ncbi:Ricin-type beta-trefoil lectin domain protein [Mycobacterium marinum]|uniref:Ricin-type beta-trefoil lectin domain protein n=2 Tax=Mycobacterium marinum TaxID=1781 RepID=A0A3E2MVY2_MYCMR|nr:Ricin-type beta-trefoil lectin domain protein [Mycobacterium marinum]RFZ65562.1 Ricin-type beta-trefoil lectin domain protein [Mycobacterium marinum]
MHQTCCLRPIVCSGSGLGVHQAGGDFGVPKLKGGTEMGQSQLMGGLRRVIVVVSMVFGAATFNAGQAGADGPVQLKSRLGDVCLDAPSGSWITPVVINPCNGTDFQRWNLTDAQQLESVAFPGECLNMPGQSWAVHLQPCVDWFSQHWTIQPNGQVTNEFGGCLTVLGGPAPGTWVATRFCNGDAPDQGWDSVA